MNRARTGTLVRVLVVAIAAGLVALAAGCSTTNVYETIVDDGGGHEATTSSVGDGAVSVSDASAAVPDGSAAGDATTSGSPDAMLNGGGTDGTLIDSPSVVDAATDTSEEPEASPPPVDGGPDASNDCKVYANVPGVLCDGPYPITSGPYASLACLNPPYNALPYEDYAVCPPSCTPPSSWAEYTTYYGQPTYCIPYCGNQPCQP